MSGVGLSKLLAGKKEIKITVSGRRTGRKIQLPVWFILEDETIYLVPVRGSDSDWFKNTLKNPTVMITAGGTSLEAKTEAVTRHGQVAEIVDRFRKKYGTGEVKKYYSKLDVAVALRTS